MSASRKNRSEVKSPIVVELQLVLLHQLIFHIHTHTFHSTEHIFGNIEGSLTNVHLYKHLVIVKHRLGHMYCHIPAVKELYLRCLKENDWDEHEERDSKEFLELE